MVTMQWKQEGDHTVDLKLSEENTPQSLAVAFESHGIVNNANNDFLAAYPLANKDTPIVQEESKS
jgi:hypothetical protein